METQESVPVSDAEKVVIFRRRLVKMSFITFFAVLLALGMIAVAFLTAYRGEELCKYEIKIAVNAAKNEEVQPKCDCPVSVTVDGGFCQLIDGKCCKITSLE